MVYCATVPNGTLIIRRNGKIAVCGNCEVYQVVAAYMMRINEMPARAVIEAQREQYRAALALEAQRDREREREKKLREESETRRDVDDAWTPKKFSL
jgi:hypothetical protein